MAIRSLSAINAPKQNTTYSANVVGSENAAENQPLPRFAKRIATMCLGVAVLGSTGCTMTQGLCRAVQDTECIDEFMLGYRNKAMAEKAWHCQKDRFGDVGGTFKAGFIAGYLEVASGGPGCCPSVAPSDYWGWRYQSAEGQAAVNQWFAGYPYGVQAAEQAGLGHFHQLQVGGAASTPAPLAPRPLVRSNSPADVANPFYSAEEEFVPAPEPFEEIPNDADAGEDSDALELEMQEPDSVYNETRLPTPMAAVTQEEPALVSQSDLVKRHEAAVSATLGDQLNQMEEDFPEAAEVVIDDIFGASTQPVPTDAGSDDLPFSFD